MAKYGKVDRRTLLKMMGAAGASATVISTCGTSDEISGQGLSGAKFDKSIRLATAGPGGNKNWKPGHALKFLPPEDMPHKREGVEHARRPAQGETAELLSAHEYEPQVGNHNEGPVSRGRRRALRRIPTPTSVKKR